MGLIELIDLIRLNKTVWEINLNSVFKYADDAISANLMHPKSLELSLQLTFLTSTFFEPTLKGTKGDRWFQDAWKLVPSAEISGEAPKMRQIEYLNEDWERQKSNVCRVSRMYFVCSFISSYARTNSGYREIQSTVIRAWFKVVLMQLISSKEAFFFQQCRSFALWR